MIAQFCKVFQQNSNNPEDARCSVPIELRPGDQTQLVRLHEMRMDRDDANTETVRATLRRRDDAAVNIIPLALSRRTLAQYGYGGILDSAVVGFAMIRFDSHVRGIHGSEVHSGRNL